MKFTTAFLLIFCCLFTTSLMSQNVAAPYAPNEILIKFKPTISDRDMKQNRQDIVGLSAKNLGTSKLECWIFPPTIRIQGQLFNTIEEVIAFYSIHPDVEFVEPNYVLGLDLNSDDTYVNQLWGLNNTGQTGGLADADIDAPEAWDILTEVFNIIIGVIDTGIDWRHPDLVDNIWQNMGEDIDNDGQVIQWNGTFWEFDPDDINGIDDDGNGFVDDFVGWDFANDDNDPFDDHAHGTHVAGTIGAEGNNAEGISGVAWKVQMAALKFLRASGIGYTDDAVLAVNYARENGFHITNNSWGGTGFSQALYQAIQASNDAGQLFVAAAGNNGENVDSDGSPLYPAAYDVPNIISVAATNHEDNLANFSNYGATSVDLAAPGQSIYSCIPDNAYASFNGTSMATPHVAGAIALLWENCDQLSHLEIKTILMNTVDVIPAMAGKCISQGRLNIFNALQTDEGSATFSYNIAGLTADFLPDYTEGNTYSWDFGDGTTSTTQAPSHTYANGGSYMVSLTVENECASYSYQEVIELAIPCDASFSIESSSDANDNAICQGDTGTFTNTTEDAVSSEWRVDNVVVSTANTFDYVFDDLGIHVITLQTTTNTGSCSLSQEVTVHGNARNLYLGEDIYSCETSVTIFSELPDMAAYLWDLNGAPFASGTQDLVVTQSGTYRLTVIDFCDEITSDEVIVDLQDCQEDNNVWPGNADNNDIVNYEDAMSVIISVGKMGPLRDNASANWSPQPAVDWLETDENNVNLKHKDCDGDGLVDPSMEASVIQVNYGKIVPTNPANFSTPPLNPSYRLFAERSGIQVTDDQTQVIYDLILENISNQSLDIAAVGFKMKYRNASNPILEASNSELGEEQENLHIFSKMLPNNRIDIAVGRTDGTNLNQAPTSELLLIQFIVDENAVLDDPNNTIASNSFISLNDIVIMENQGNKIYLEGSSASSNSGNQGVDINLLVDPLSVAMTATHALECPAGATATAIPTGGMPPYSFLWENGQTTESVSALYPGLHSVTVSDAANEEVEGLIFVEGTISCTAVLPLEWLEFKASPTETAIVLNWTTINENNVQYFELQRSTDNIHFETIYSTPAKNNQQVTNDYQFLDNKVKRNTTYYYRIKILETEQSHFSNVRAALLKDTSFGAITIQPNPVNDEAVLSFTAIETLPVEIILYNQLGQKVKTFPYHPEEQNSTVTLDFSAFQNGVYWLEVLQHQQSQVLKMVKQ